MHDACGEAEIDLHLPLLGRPHDATRGTIKILAVDDNPSFLEFVPMVADAAGFTEIQTVSSGALALDAIEQQKIAFDCFLLDISMPGLDGIDLCARVRQISGYAQTPIIMLIAIRDMECLDRVLNAVSRIM